MSGVLVVLIVVAALAVVVIGWGAVTVTSARLAATPARSVFDIEEATARVADRLPDVVAAKLSHDDLRVLLRWQLTYLRERGMATFGGVDRAAERAARRSSAAVAHEDDIVDELLARSAAEGIDAGPVDIVCVVELTTEYLVGIGAVGAPVDLSAIAEAPRSAGELDRPE